jgi:hypothetical protein
MQAACEADSINLTGQAEAAEAFEEIFNWCVAFTGASYINLNPGWLAVCDYQCRQ